MPDQGDGVPIQEAARRLGISPQAVRKRARRGTLPAYKVEDIWHVIVPKEEEQAVREPARPTAYDAARPGSDPITITLQLVETLREQLAEKDRQLAAREREVQELHVMLQTAQRMIPANVQDASQGPESRQDDFNNDRAVEEAKTSPGGAERGQQASDGPRRRSWLARLLGLE